MKINSKMQFKTKLIKLNKIKICYWISNELKIYNGDPFYYHDINSDQLTIINISIVKLYSTRLVVLI